MNATGSRIDDVILHAIGGGWGSESLSPDSIPVRIIRGADFPAAALQTTDSAPVRFEVASKAARRIVEVDDILLEISGGTKSRPTGRTVRISSAMLENSPEPLIPASFCRLIRIDKSVAHPGFVYYALQDLYQRGGTWEYQNQSTGIANFQFELFRRRYRLPDLAPPEQQAIAEVLGALDDKIAANTRLAATADELASTLVRRASRGNVRRRLDEIATIIMGSSPKGDTLNEDRDGNPFFQGVRDFGMRSPNNRVWTTAPVRFANAGDVLISVRAPVGEINVADGDVSIGRGLAALRSTTGHQHTLFHGLRLERTAWEEHEAGGTVFGSINRAQLHAVEMPEVTDADRLEFELTPIEHAISSALNENRTLAATRDALLPHLMSGKLRVRDAESTVRAIS